MNNFLIGGISNREGRRPREELEKVTPSSERVASQESATVGKKENEKETHHDDEND